MYIKRLTDGIQLMKFSIKTLTAVLAVLTIQATGINAEQVPETSIPAGTTAFTTESVKSEDTKKDSEASEQSADEKASETKKTEEEKPLKLKKASLGKYKEDFTVNELTDGKDIPQVTTTVATTTAASKTTTPTTTTKKPETTTTTTTTPAPKPTTTPATTIPSSEIPVTEPPVTTIPTQAEIPDTIGYLTFTTYGYGHGVGLSQNGANHYANFSGYNYAQILQHYFPGVEIRNTGTAEDEIITIDGVQGTPLELIPQVCYNEIGSNFNPEAIKAQAIAAYTYVKFNGNVGSGMLLKPNPPQNVINAVAEVLGQACYYNGDFALTMFCASTGGASASASDIFYSDVPYLRSVYCEYDEGYDPNYAIQTVFTKAEVKEKLERNLGITLSDDASNWLQVEYGDGGYVRSVTIDGQVTVKGNTLRSYLGLKSPKFTVSYSE